MSPRPVPITLDTQVTVAGSMPRPLRTALLDRFTPANPQYAEAHANGRSTRGIAPFLAYVAPTADGGLVLPRGAVERVAGLAQEHGCTVHWSDHTHLAPPVAFEERISLSAAQEAAVTQMLTRRVGVLEAPAGSGKTIMAMALIARRRQPALLIVHTKELAHQAIARAGLVLGLTPAEIGVSGDGQCTIGERLTVALVQTLARGIPAALLDVGHVIVDECQHAPAQQTAAVVAQFPARYRLGLTATPFRRDGLDQVIFWHLGPIVATMDRADLVDRLIKPSVIKRSTGVTVRGDSFTALVSDLAGDRHRNDLIVSDIVRAVRRGRRCLVLSDRVEHVETLAWLRRKAGVTAAALHGQLPRAQRQSVAAAGNAGELAVVVATGALLGEGFDCPRLDALFLVTPVSFAGRVEQYIGRVSRTAPGKRDAIVVDYCDHHGMLWSAWKKRTTVYRRIAGGISDFVEDAA